MAVNQPSEGQDENETRVPEPLRGPHETYESEVLRRVWDRLNVRNEHSMIALVGEEGSGKSYTALRIAKAIDPSFTAERVIFDMTELLKILRDGDHQPGQAYVLDESGVSLGNRTWQDRAQILANQALQLIRSHNLALFFTLPRLGELDSQTQGRLQAFFEIEKKVPDEYVEGTWLYLDPDRRDYSGKIYQKCPRVYRNGQRIKVSSLRFGPPSDDLVEPYEKAKREFQEEVYEETIAELEEDDDGGDEQRTPKEIAEEIREDGGPESFVRDINNGTQRVLDSDLIAAEYDVGEQRAKRVKKLLKPEVDDDVL